MASRTQLFLNILFGLPKHTLRLSRSIPIPLHLGRAELNFFPAKKVVIQTKDIHREVERLKRGDLLCEGEAFPFVTQIFEIYMSSIHPKAGILRFLKYATRASVMDW